MPFNPPIRDSQHRSKFSGALSSLVEAEKMMQVAFLLPCSALVGWLLGAWLDKVFHQAWISVAGIVFGGISGLYYVIRLVTSRKPNSGSRSGPGNAAPKDNP